jgi:Ca2+-binding RTX toxin-like protein
MGPRYREGRSRDEARTTDPRFVDAASFDYRPVTRCPLRDRGATCTAGRLARRDAANHFWIAGANVDMGAFEIGAGKVPRGSNLFGTGVSGTIDGTPGADVPCGFGGNDSISGHGGEDHIFGGRGNDLVQGRTLGTSWRATPAPTRSKGAPATTDVSM